MAQLILKQMPEESSKCPSLLIILSYKPTLSFKIYKFCYWQSGS